MDAAVLHARFEEDFDAVYARPPLHVMRRIAALIGDGDKVVYTDFRLEEAGQYLHSGEVLVVTKAVVVQAHMTASLTNPDEDAGSSVQVASWSRKKLVRLAIHDDETGRVNRDGAWAEDWAGRWPLRATVTLHFDGAIDPLTLPVAGDPSKKQREALLKTVGSLSSDLH